MMFADRNLGDSLVVWWHLAKRDKPVPAILTLVNSVDDMPRTLSVRTMTVDRLDNPSVWNG
jgi:hypothetical protein